MATSSAVEFHGPTSRYPVTTTSRISSSYDIEPTDSTVAETVSGVGSCTGTHCPYRSGSCTCDSKRASSATPIGAWRIASTKPSVTATVPR